MHDGNGATWNYFYTSSTHIVLIREWNSDAWKQRLGLIKDAKKSKHTDILWKKNKTRTATKITADLASSC